MSQRTTHHAEIDRRGVVARVELVAPDDAAAQEQALTWAGPDRAVGDLTVEACAGGPGARPKWRFNGRGWDDVSPLGEHARAVGRAREAVERMQALLGRAFDVSEALYLAGAPRGLAEPHYPRKAFFATVQWAFERVVSGRFCGRRVLSNLHLCLGAEGDSWDDAPPSVLGWRIGGEHTCARVGVVRKGRVELGVGPVILPAEPLAVLRYCLGLRAAPKGYQDEAWSPWPEGAFRRWVDDAEAEGKGP